MSRFYKPKTIVRIAHSKGFRTLEEISTFLGCGKNFMSKAISDKRTLGQKYYMKVWALDKFESSAQKDTLQRFYSETPVEESVDNREPVRFSAFRRIIWNWLFRDKIKDFNLIYKVTT